MANEIKLPIGTTGLSGLYARAIQGTTLGSAISLSEVSGAGGVYVGTMTGSAGYYGFLFYDSGNELIGTAPVYYWDGTNFTGLNDSSLTSTQADQLTALFNATTDGTGATVFSINALQNAPSGSGENGFTGVI